MSPLLWLMCAGNLVVSSGAFALGGMLEPMAASLSVSVAQAGQLMTVYALVMALACPVAVAVTGRVARKFMLVASMCLVVVGNVLAFAAAWADAQAYAILMVSRVVMALGGGIFMPLAAAAAVALVPPAQRGRALSVVILGVSLSFVISAPLATWMAYGPGWRWLFALVAVCGVVLVILLAVHVPARLQTSPADLAAFRRVFVNLALVRALLVAALFFSAIFAVSNYIGPFLRVWGGLAPSALSWVLLAFGICSVLGNVLGGWLTDRVGSLTLMAVVLLSFLLIFTGFLFSAGHGGVTVGLLLVWGVIGFMFMPAQQALLVNLAPLEAGALLSLNSAMLYLGSALGGALGGLVLGLVGMVGLPVTGLAFVALSGALLWVNQGHVAGAAARS